MDSEKVHLEYLKWLFSVNGFNEYKISVCHNNKRCRDILDLASKHGHLKVIQYLVEEYDVIIDEKYCECDYSTDRCKMVLENACKNGHLDILKYCVSKGVNVNKYKYDYTILDEALCYGHLDIVNWLILESNFDISRIDMNDRNYVECGIPNYDINLSESDYLKYLVIVLTGLSEKFPNEILDNIKEFL